MSITLTNIYLTYKREIIIHIKPMAMAVTHMAGSRGVGVNAEEVPAWGRPHWRVGEEISSWGLLVGTWLQTDLLANTHCKQQHSSRAGPAAARKGI